MVEKSSSHHCSDTQRNDSIPPQTPANSIWLDGFKVVGNRFVHIVVLVLACWALFPVTFTEHMDRCSTRILIESDLWGTLKTRLCNPCPPRLGVEMPSGKAGLLKRSSLCNHLKHVAFSTPKQGETTRRQVAMFRCIM